MNFGVRVVAVFVAIVGLDGIRVGRYADEIPAGQVVNLTPSDRARILLRIKDNFPTQQYLGPIIVNRPVYEFENEELPEFLRDSEPTDVISKLPSLDRRSTGQFCWPERGCPEGRGGLTDFVDAESELPAYLSNPEPTGVITLENGKGLTERRRYTACK